VLPIIVRASRDEDRPLAAPLDARLWFALAIASGYALAHLLLEFGRVP
jgi:hypothetical protein